MDVLFYIYLAVGGAIIGSFLNVVIYRLPRKESLVRPGSHCPHCGKPVRWYDNIPIISYTLLGGSCRQCGKPISLRYPFVEFLNGALYLAAGLKFGQEWALLPALFFISVLIVIFFIDLDHYIIPNVIVLPAAAIGLAAMLAIEPDRWLELTLAGVISAAFFFIIVMVMPRGMGMGDVKLVLMMGFFLGKPVLVALFVGFLTGALTGVTLMLAGVKGRKSQIPFGPFLAIGALIALFYGSWIIDKYTGTFGV
ncbi:MAG: prepilin peptidase [Gaiellales bacterium]|nr:MAG: prepilin peptidase [Gaiellales bacterium]